MERVLTALRLRGASLLALVAVPAVVLTAGASAAEDTWIRQAPIPTTRNLTAGYFVSPTHGFVSGTNQHLLETTDGGNTWTVRHENAYGSDPYYNVYFSDAMHGFVTGNNQGALRTTDGGVTWTAMNGVPAGSWYHIDFQTPLEGFIGANGAVAHTDDAGVSWTVRSGYPNCPVIYGMDFRDASLGLAAGYQVSTQLDGVFRTTDGGRSWTRTLAGNCNDAVFLDADTALALGGSDYRIHRSDDSGLTWTPISPPFGSDGPIDLDPADASVILGVGANGDLWRSADGGVSWTLTFEGLGALPASWSVRAFPGGHAWAAGDVGLLLASSDQGRTWRVVTRGVAMEVEDIDMFSDQYGLSVHYYGYLCRTIDAGRRWEVQKLEVTGQEFGRDEGLSAVDILNEDFAAAAGPGGVVFKSFDTGRTWESVGYPRLPGEFWIHDVAFTTPLEGWVVGQDLVFSRNLNLYRTFDGGWSWETTPLSNRYGYVAVEFLDEQRGWLQSFGAPHLRTLDGGQTWSTSTLPDNQYGDPTIEDMDYADANTGWAGGWWGYMARTTNGGASWQTQNIGADIRAVLDVVAVSPTQAWAIAVTESPDLDPVVLHTTNGGSTWTRQALGAFPETLSAISASPSGHVWAGGFGGLIYTNQPPQGVDCDSILKFSARCRSGRVVGKVTSALPAGTALTVTRNGGDPKIMTINDRGRGKVKWTGQSGTQVLAIVECPELGTRETLCE